MAKMLPSDADFQVIVAIQMHNADLDHSSVVMVSSSLMICIICDKVHFTVNIVEFNMDTLVKSSKMLGIVVMFVGIVADLGLFLLLYFCS